MIEIQLNVHSFFHSQLNVDSELNAIIEILCEVVETSRLLQDDKTLSDALNHWHR